MDSNQKFLSDLLVVIQHRVDTAENDFQRLILGRVVAVLEEYIVE